MDASPLTPASSSDFAAQLVEQIALTKVAVDKAAKLIAEQEAVVEKATMIVNAAVEERETAIAGLHTLTLSAAGAGEDKPVLAKKAKAAPTKRVGLKAARKYAACPQPGCGKTVAIVAATGKLWAHVCGPKK